MTLPLEDMRRLAVLTTQDNRWEISGDHVRLVTSRNINGDVMNCAYFRPSLTGEDWQKAQALDVIRFATKLKTVDFIWLGNDCVAFVKEGRATYEEATEISRGDILTAASLAILESDKLENGNG